MVNPFEQFAEQTIVAPRKARVRADAKRAEVLAAKAEETGTCLKEWHRWRQGQVSKALAGPHGAAIADLLTRLKAATHWKDADGVADPQGLDPDTQFLARRLINDRIMQLREAAGLAPFDDEIPW
jgi:hypothetical protein